MATRAETYRLAVENAERLRDQAVRDAEATKPAAMRNPNFTADVQQNGDAVFRQLSPAAEIRIDAAIAERLADWLSQNYKPAIGGSTNGR